MSWFSKPNVERLLGELSHGHMEIREKALAKLEAIAKAGLSPTDGAKLIRAAVQTYPPGRYSWRDTSAQLIQFAAEQPAPEYVPVVLEVFDQLGTEAQDWATRLVASVDHPEAARAFVDLIGRYSALGRDPESPIAIPLERDPRYCDILFPALLEFGTSKHLRRMIYYLLLRYCQQDQVAAEVLPQVAAGAVSMYRQTRDEVLPLQDRSAAERRANEEYQEAQVTGGLMLDLFGYLPGEAVMADLEDALSYKDTHLKLFAIKSLLSHAGEVGLEDTTPVAADPERRLHLYNFLLAHDRTDLFPPQYLTQESFAEAEMVGWLAYPTELGQPPDQIELMRVESLDLADEGIFDWYLFRFRCLDGWAAENGWMAGVAGPFSRENAPSPESYGDTFSKFEPWESKSPEEHVAEIVELMQAWREAHGESL